MCTCQTKPLLGFRYDTGEAKVPWAAVGEQIAVQDLAAVIRFLLKPGSDTAEYERRMRVVERSLSDLASVATLASKLSLGDEVSRLEQEINRILAAHTRCS